MGGSKEYRMAIKIAGEVEKSFKSSMGLTQKELKGIAKQAATTSNAARHSLGSGFEGANKVVDSFSRGAKKALKAVATAATVTATAVGTVAAASISAGSDFEAQMSTVEAISGATTDQMQKLTEKAKELGANTAFSATEAGEAMEYMAMAGWKTEDMLSGIDGVMSLAAASGEELGTVSDIVTDAMTAFGMKADEANTFSDVLAKTASSANTNVSMMGETFKYVAPVAGALGYSVQDAATAIGLMANSGIKASAGGTSLRSWMSRMASPTKEVSKAMKKLGISLTDSEGNMYSLQEMMIKTRKAFDGLSKSEKTQYASALAGKSGMSGLLAIVNASEKDFKALSKEIDNAAGSAKEMADIKLDNLQGDITLFQSAMSGLGIEIYDQIEAPLRGGMQEVTNIVGTVTASLQKSKIAETAAKWFSEWIAKTSKNIPTLIRKLKETGEGITDFAEPFLNVARWMVEHPAVVESTLAGIAATIATVKVASKIHEVVGAFSGLAGILTNPFAAGILAVGAAIGGAVSIATYVKKCEAEMKKQNLAEHFGTISLSLDELNDVANRILDDGSLTKLNNTLEEFDKVDDFADSIKDAVRDIDKMNWKVSVGMKLTKDEKQAYKEDIKQYIQNTQDMVQQQRYAISLSIDLLTEKGSELGGTVDSFLAGKEAELAKLGKKLQKTVNKAFDDGLLTVDEEKKIQEIQQQMANISEGITQSNFNASLEVIKGEYSGANLTPETFENLQKELQETADEAEESYKEALKESVAELDYQYQNGDISEKKYKSGVEELQKGYREKVSEVQSKVSEFSLATIMEQYNDELKGASDTFDEIMSNYMSRSDWQNSAATMWDFLPKQFDGMLDSSTKDAIEELLKQLEPTEQQLKQLEQQYKEAGKEVPKSIAEGIQQIELLKAYTEDEDSLWAMIKQTLLSDDDYVKMIEEIRERGGYIPKEIEDAVASKTDASAKSSADTVRNSFTTAVVKALSNTIDAGLKINTNTAETNSSLQEQANNARTKMQSFLNSAFSPTFNAVMKIHAEVEKAKINADHNAKGSIITKPTLSWFAEEGPEAAIPLDGSERAKSLWVRAGSILGMYGGTSKEQTTLASQAEKMLNRDTDSLQTTKLLKALNNSEISSSTNISYSPQITIKGNASREDVVAANEIAEEKFEQMIERYFRQKKRVAF